MLAYRRLGKTKELAHKCATFAYPSNVVHYFTDTATTARETYLSTR